MKKKISTAFDIVKKFEETIASYCGSKYAVAVDSCCNAIFLCCIYNKVKEVYLPHRTYPGVACAVINSGGKVRFRKYRKDWIENWYGAYRLEPYHIYDSALRFGKNIHLKDTYTCLSFHVKKHIPIGRGGMILCDDEKAYKWFRKARFDGRDEVPLSEDNIDMIGWNMYMTPEQAARGLLLFDLIKDKDLLSLDSKKQGYPDLRKIKVYR